MTYDVMPLDELVRSFVDAANAFSVNRQDEEIDKKIAAFGTALVARGELGAQALRSLLADKHEQVQFTAAAWLSELDPYVAAQTLERLVREAEDPAIKGFARLKLHNNRERGFLPAR